MDNNLVGAEKGLKELIGENEILPLLESAVRAGASWASLSDAQGKPLCTYGDLMQSALTESRSLFIEGERIGDIAILGSDERYIKVISGLLQEAINIIINNNLKRILTTDMHRSVVDQSYEELLETNKRLSISEDRYRQLVNDLDRKIQDNTEELKHAHAKLLQQEKMVSVGQLAAGIAHEINNPLGFISSNLNTLKKYISKIKDMLCFYRTTMKDVKITRETVNISEEKWKDLKLDFIFFDIEELIKQNIEGTERVKKIVSDLKGFSHIDDKDESVIDINAEIERTLNVLTHEIPGDAEIIKEYDVLPGFTCIPALICQVFLNVIINSLQSREDGLKLIISTRHEDGKIRISFSDNGTGIPDNIKSRIFEPFFTTKEVGKGTGMGLTVAYEIVTQYRGSIEVDRGIKEGTVFIITLPLKEEKKGQNVQIR